GAGLLVRTLENLKSVNPGFETRNILLFRMEPSLNGYTGERSKNLYSELLARVQAMVGVVLAAYWFVDLLSVNSCTTLVVLVGCVRDSTRGRYGLAAGAY